MAGEGVRAQILLGSGDGVPEECGGHSGVGRDSCFS